MSEYPGGTIEAQSDISLDLDGDVLCERVTSAQRIHGDGEEATAKIGISCPHCLHYYSVLFGEKCVSNLIKSQLMRMKQTCHCCAQPFPVTLFTITPI